MAISTPVIREKAAPKASGSPPRSVTAPLSTDMALV